MHGMDTLSRLSQLILTSLVRRRAGQTSHSKRLPCNTITEQDVLVLTRSSSEGSNEPLVLIYVCMHLSDRMHNQDVQTRRTKGRL